MAVAALRDPRWQGVRRALVDMSTRDGEAEESSYRWKTRHTILEALVQREMGSFGNPTCWMLVKAGTGWVSHQR